MFILVYFICFGSSRAPRKQNLLETLQYCSGLSNQFAMCSYLWAM